MFKAISNWWNKDKLAIQQLHQQLNDANNVFATTQNTMFEFKAQFEAEKTRFEQTLSELKTLETKYASLYAEYEQFKKANPDMKAEGVLTPWFVVGVNGESELKGLKTYMDWNDAMIQHMKDKKLSYKTEDEMIQHFIAQLYEHVLIVLENKIVDDSDRHRPGDFE